MSSKKTNIAKLRDGLSHILDYVQDGHEVEIQKRNISIAKIIPIKKYHSNKTKLGIGKGTAKILGDILEPIMESD